jgi:predicted aconitase with swiveling domain
MSASGATHSGRTLVAGAGRGEAVRLDEPLSLWGGMDPQTGIIIDPHHPQAGRSIAGYVVLMPSGRGSSSSSSILAEAIRAGAAPAAILLLEADSILALGSIVAAELYGRTIPVLVLEGDAYRSIPSGARVAVEAGSDGAVIRVDV